MPILVALCSWILVSSASAGLRVEVSPDAHETAYPGSDESRDTYNRGEVPLPVVPDWTGSRARATGGLCFGDVDNDGDLDLVVGTYWANMYPPIPDYYNFAYLNVGGMLEADPSWISVDERHTTDVKAGTINADGYVDFLFGNGGEALHPSQVFYGTNGMLPTSAGWVSNDNCWTIGCALHDLDHDGDLDLATANQGNTANPYRPVYLFRNLGDGLETVPSWQSAQIGITNAADFGDMDGDGWADLAVSGWVNWQSGVFRNVEGSLTNGFVWTTGHPERTDKGVGWARVDSDLWPDLAIGSNSGGDRLYGNEEGMLSADPIWESGESYHGCQDLTWVDIDRDGDEDLATINFGNGHVRIYLNNDGALSTIADWQYDASSSGTAIAFGDVNGDEMPDLAIGVANGPNMLFLNTGTPLGLEEDANDLPQPGTVRLLASPQPSRGGIVFRVQGDAPLLLDRISIYDIHGRQVGEVSPASGTAMRRTMTLSYSGDLAPGIYFAVAEGSLDGVHSFRASRRIVNLRR